MNRILKEKAFKVYIPLVVTAVFLLGCLSYSLISAGRSVSTIAYSDGVSGSDANVKENSIRKSPVYEDNGLKYRMVSAADLGLETEKASESAPVSAHPVSSEETKDDTEGGLQLPFDHYINFVPHKSGYTAYLTFDDGPSENTEAILDILDFYNVKATFFVIYHENMEDKYKAIVDAGHTIALHSYSHDYSKVYSGEAAFFSEMESISDYIYSQTGVRTKLLRFPGGSSNTISKKYSKELMTILKESVKEKGYVYQDWNVDSCDAEKANTSPDRLLFNISNSLKEQKTAVVLMHDAGDKTGTTVQALPRIIEFFFAKGYAMEKMDMNTEEIHHNW